jgi:polyhydroxyalkanoate synthesis repressor PhaR
MDRKPILIKKYENRRLYDSTNSRYINLDEVAQLVKDGREVRVVDAANGEDLTRLILTQIIMENAKEADSNFPLDTLRQMVIASGRATQESALQYMKAMLDMYQNAYRVMAPPLSPFEFMHPGGKSHDSEAATLVQERPGQPRGEVGELKRRVEELESVISNLKVQNAGKAKKTRSRKPPKPRRSG